MSFGQVFRNSRCALLWTACAIVGCRSSSDPASPSIQPLKVEFAGCAAVQVGPICELRADRALRLWVESGPSSTISVRVGDRELMVESTTVGAGQLLRFEVPDNTDVVRVLATDGPAQGQWRLRVKSAQPIPIVVEAKKLRAARAFDEGADLLRRGLDELPEAHHGPLLGLLARLELNRRHPEEAFRLFDRAIVRNRSAGRLSEMTNDAIAWAYALVYDQQRLSKARAVLDRSASEVASYDEGRARLTYHRGVVERERRDLRSALRHFADADARAQRLGMLTLRRNVQQAWAWTLQALGRQTEALRMLDDIVATMPANLGPCERARLYNNIGWLRILAVEAGTGRYTPGSSLDPEPPIQRSAELYRTKCEQPDMQIYVGVNLALVALQKNQPDKARRALDAAPATDPESDAYVALWRDEIEGRLALAQHRPEEALASYDKLLERGVAYASAEIMWRAALGRAEALEASDRNQAAIAAYRQAEDQLEEQSLRVPLGEGRDTFLGDRERSARQLIDLLIRLNRPDEALRAARRSRARVLATLRRTDRLAHLSAADQHRWTEAIAAYPRKRAALNATVAKIWQSPANQLERLERQRTQQEAQLQGTLDAAMAMLTEGALTDTWAAPLPGELYLAFHPTRHGWAGLAADTRGVDGQLLGAIDTHAPLARLSEQLLEPFRPRIDQAKRIIVLPYGALRTVDFHALPWQGRPLIASVPVAYAVDLPVLPGSDRAPLGALSKALLVVDPRGDLEGARRAGREVRSALAATGGWQIVELTGQAATASRTVSALADADLLHYAGHGAFGGRGGWQSALFLADSGRLTVGDILALPRAPQRVVLSGCETARGSEEVGVETVGLAQAFVVVGAQEVIAAIRPVKDALAQTLSRALYAHGAAAHSRTSLVAALRAAQLEIQQAQPTDDWSAFRVLVR